jgi:hypothetical protein
MTHRNKFVTVGMGQAFYPRKHSVKVRGIRLKSAPAVIKNPFSTERTFD